MDMIEKPPDQNDMVFDMNKCKSAPLVCHTLIERGWKMAFGFTATNKFYSRNMIEGYSSEWIHDDELLRLKHYFADSVDSLTTIFKYDSFQSFNLNVTNDQFCVDSESFEITVLFVSNHTPIFSYKIFNEQTIKFEHGRYFKQYHTSAVNGYWSDLINATAFQLTFKLNKETFYSWMKKMLERLPCTVTFKEMATIPYPFPNPLLLEFAVTLLPFKTRYYIECIQSHGLVGNFLLYYYLYQQNNITMLMQLGENAQWNLVTDYFCSLLKFLKKDISLPLLNFDPNDYPQKQIIGSQYVSIATAIITPAKIIFVGEEDSLNNRGFRKLGVEKVLQVKFLDQDGTNFPRDENLLLAKMRTSLINGISVGGKVFRHFGSSSSLFKQHGSYFVDANCQQEIIQIINEWAVFKEEPAAKVAARLGLFFSSATEIHMKLRNNEIGHLKDFMSSPTSYNNEPEFTFSDGIGVIDKSFACQIRDELGLAYTPSAFQFRCLGCKGMVAVDPYNNALVSNAGPYIVMFRDSQTKFEALGERCIDFDVVKFSSPAPLKLHKSFIALLVALASDQGKLDVVERRLHELFTQAFIEIIKSLIDPNTFARTLKGLPKHFPIDKFYPQQLIQQDFFRSIVEVNAVNLGKQLNCKAQIPIPESLGRSVLGVLDEYGILEPNQIFLQISTEIHSKSPNPKTAIITGKVGVTKSPMYHLGDIRYVEAVDHPAFRHHLDVIVFSNHGDRPLPDQIGGGDLDGDCYSVFWDKELLLEHSKPAEFPTPDSSHLPKIDIAQLHQSHTDFRIQFEQLNNLEQLSNCFNSHITLHHPDHPEVEKISLKADVAVNSFKSGVFAPPIERQEKPVYNPNFCIKRHEPMFDSNHILCQLYKRSTKIYLMLQLMQDRARKMRMMKLEKDIEVSDYAKNMFDRYCFEIGDLMLKFNVKSEAELFANVNLDPPGSFSTYRMNRDEETRNALLHSQLSEIIGRFRKEILYRFKPDWKRDLDERCETLSTYVIQEYQIPTEMRKMAKEFQKLCCNNDFMSFQFLVIEALDLSYDNNMDVTDQINQLINDLTFEYQNLLESELATTNEGLLIELAFFPANSPLNKPDLQINLTETIIQYPSFVLSVPAFYKDGFEENYKILKDISGCTDIAIRLRKNKRHFLHYTVSCEGTLQSCLKLERILTPYLENRPSWYQLSLNEMKERKTQEMQRILEEVFGFTPPPSQKSIHHSTTTPELNPHNELQSRSCNDIFESYDREGPSPWRDYFN